MVCVSHEQTYKSGDLALLSMDERIPIKYRGMNYSMFRSICEEEKDSTILTDLKFRFCEFIRKMIVSSDSCGELNFESLAPGKKSLDRGKAFFLVYCFKAIWN